MEGWSTQAMMARDLFWRMQDHIVAALLEVDGSNQRIREDVWEHTHGGGGRTRVLTELQVFEKGGVNVSAVRGPALPPSVAESVPAGRNLPFVATGLSLVLHPRNPHVPTVHMNCRFFQAGEDVWWFGGGADLTPYYPQREDVVHFHRTLQAVSDSFDPTWYPRYKAWCDDYFYLKHRKEHRGVGGIFFDYCGATGLGNADDSSQMAADRWAGFDRGLQFVEAVCRGFVEAYVPIVAARKDQPWTERERWFQEVRRGRYVEFNLVYDRGTLFGLQTGGRIESILMSLPPTVRYVYDWQPEPGSPEAELTSVYLQPQPWAES